MNVMEFCEGIRLQEKAKELVFQKPVDDTEYQFLKLLFEVNKESFYSEVLSKQEPATIFLYCYCKMACETWEKYQEKGISEEIFWDTFSDFTIWCGNCKERNGYYGLMEYGWLWRHIEMTIFKLGRLQFEKMPSEWEFVWNGKSIKKGDPVISIHIPQGEPLDIEKSYDSVHQAYEFWGKDYPYVCHSWLLGKELKEFMRESSNIMRFQNFFEILSTDYVFREGEERIFKKLSDNPEEYPEQTSLQKSAKKWLLNGGQLSSGFGILKKNI